MWFIDSLRLSPEFPSQKLSAMKLLFKAFPPTSFHYIEWKNKVENFVFGLLNPEPL